VRSPVGKTMCAGGVEAQEPIQGIMLFLVLKMDAAMLKHTLLSVQQTRSCSIYPGPARVEVPFKYAKHYAANLYANKWVTDFVGSSRAGLGVDLAVVAARWAER
jgi:hypothetical protein